MTRRVKHNFTKVKFLDIFRVETLFYLLKKNMQEVGPDT